MQSGQALSCSPALSSHPYVHAYLPRKTYKTCTNQRCRLVVARAAARAATLYDLLELSPDVGISDIKQAYRQMARRYHPDVCPSNQSEESTRRFIEIQEAYETLSDPRRRAIYDHAVAMGRGSGMSWTSNDKDTQPSDWKSRWEGQLFELKRRSSMKAQKTNSWGAQVRRQNGLHGI